MASAADVSSLARKLKTGEDFRVRVRAALALGKTHDKRARVPLEGALGDSNPAVRAAAAAALRVLGDPKAIGALERRQNDKSSAVRSQVKSSLAALRKIAARAHERPSVLIKLGDITFEDSAHERMAPTMERQSRKKLDRLPGVMVLLDSEDPATETKNRKVPTVVVTGRLRELNGARSGSGVVYSAEVEYVVATYPGKAIVGMVHGSAQAKASPEEAKSRKKLDAIEREVLDAAIESAMRRAPAAIQAAMK